MIITSDKSYKNIEIKRGYHENDLLGGKDPYSASKGAAEIIIQSFINSYFINKKQNVAIARAGNVIGGGDWSENRLIPDCVKSWSKNKKLKSETLNQHVLGNMYWKQSEDICDLAECLYNNRKLHGEPFNFGPKQSQNKNVITLVKLMKKFWE